MKIATRYKLLRVPSDRRLFTPARILGNSMDRGVFGEYAGK